MSQRTWNSGESHYKNAAQRCVYGFKMSFVFFENETKLNYRDIVSARDTARIATCNRSGDVHVFDLETASQVTSFQADADFGGSRLAISPNGRFVATASYKNGTASVFDDCGRQLWNRNNLADIQVVAFSSDSETLYCSHGRGLVSAFDTNDGQRTRFTWFTNRINSSYRLYEHDGDQFLLSIRPPTGELISRQKLPDETSLYFAKNGTLLVSTSGEILRTEKIEQIDFLKPI